MMPIAQPWRAACTAWLALVLCACAGWQAPAMTDDAPLRQRAIRMDKDGVAVAAAVLSPTDSKRMFGADVNATNVQPVWIEVRNQTSQPLWLLRSGTDPDYFSAHEVAWSAHVPLGGKTNAEIDNHFNSLRFRNPVPPGATHSGILFTNPEHLTKLLNIDLLGRKLLVPFTLFLPVPGDAGQVGQVGQPVQPFAYPESEVRDYEDLAALRAELERMPCCATSAGPNAPGEPLNVVIIGELADIGAALVRRNYRRDMRDADKVLQVFARRPDVVTRKQGQGSAPSTFLRAWLAPVRFQGRPVYLVQVGRPAGGRFAEPGARLHPEVDEARNLLIQDMMYSGGLDKLGFVRGSGSGIASPTPAGGPLEGAPYHTDGLRAVMFFAERPLSLSEVDILDWVPFLDLQKRQPQEEANHERK